MTVSVPLDRDITIDVQKTLEAEAIERINLLYTDIRKVYSAQTVAGKLCRQILKHYQELCKIDPRLRNEELPEVTDVSDDEDEPPEPVRSFRSLFVNERRNSEMFTVNANELPDDTAEPILIASSTVLESNGQEKRKRKAGPPMSMVFADSLLSSSDTLV